MEHDVVIIGGGVGGVLAALVLGREGKRVVLLERGKEISPNGADVIKPAGLKVLSDHGLVDAMLERGARRRHMLEIYHDGELVTVLDYLRDAGETHFLLCPYSTLRDILLDELVRHENVTIQYQSVVGVVEIGQDGVSGVRLESGEHITGRLYLGADGAASCVRTALGIHVDASIYEQRMYFARFPLVDSVDEMNRLYVDHLGGLAYFYPVGLEHFRLVLGFPADEGNALVAPGGAFALRERLQRFVSRSGDALAVMHGDATFVAAPVRRMHSPRYGLGNTFLIGDAIHNVHPITGQGVNLAIEDAGVLTALLLDALAGKIGLDDAQRQYDSSRRQINEAVVRYGDRLVHSLGDRTEFEASLNLNMQASKRDIATVAHVLMQDGYTR